MITDYDCWKVEEEPVSAQTIFEHLVANAETAKKILAEAIPRIPVEPDWPEHRALDFGLGDRPQTLACGNPGEAECDSGAVFLGMSRSQG